MNSKFTFLHISDLHLAHKSKCLNIIQHAYEHGKRKAFLDIKEITRVGHEVTIITPTTYDPKILKEFERKLVRIFSNDDSFRKNAILVLTGDIATTASNENLMTAKNILSSKIDYKSLLDVPTPHFINVNTFNIYKYMYLVPGNHDRFCIKPGSNFSKQGLETFSNYFNEKWEKNERISIEEFDEYIMIFVDFTLPEDFAYKEYGNFHKDGKPLTRKEKKGSFFGKGIYTFQLKEELERIFDGIKNSSPSSKKILFFSHFALITANKDLELINSDMLIETLNKYNITNFFCGHTHEAKFDTIGNIQHICCGSTIGCDINNNFSFFKHSIIKEKQHYTLETIEYKYLFSDTYGYFQEQEPARCII